MNAHIQTHPRVNSSRTNFLGRKLIVFVAVVASLVTAALLSSCTSVQTDTANTIVYLVRHAEKLTGPDVGRDPELSEAGQARAQILAEILADKGIEHIHSTNYIRTKSTVTPLATNLGLEIEIYDPRDLPALATAIKEQGGYHLVVGHSNTTQETAIALGSETTQPAINEEREYDRLYEVQVFDEGIHTKLTRYGTPYTPAD